MDYDVLYDLARENLSNQFSFADAVDAKIAGAFGISAALVGVLAAVLALHAGAVNDSGVRPLAIGIALCFVGVLVLAVPLLTFPNWHLGPRLAPGKIDKFLGDANDAKKHAARSLVDAFEKNLKPYQGKLYRLRWSVAALTLQSVLLLALSFRVGALV